MRKFKYRFEKILAFRQHQEKQRQRELAVVLQLEQSQRQKIGDILAKQAETRREKQRHLVGAIVAYRLSGYYRYHLMLKQKELTGREVLQQIGKEVDKRRAVLIAATRQRKIYEKLKERHRARFERDTNLLMQKENDDIGQKIFIRNT
jgi:flagellar export protein FliJ